MALLAIHDGQEEDTGIAVVADWQLLSCAGIASAHARLNHLRAAGTLEGRVAANKHGFVTPVWWNPKRVPFLAGPGGDYACVDLDPAPSSASSQVVPWFDEVGVRNRSEPSLREDFATYLNDLRADSYELHPNGRLRLQ